MMVTLQTATSPEAYLSLCRRFEQHEDIVVQTLARSLLGLLEDEASFPDPASGRFKSLDDSDYEREFKSRLKLLLIFFKKDFFQWFNEKKCDACQNVAAAANPAPATHPAYNSAQCRVEVYICRLCQAATVFPRITDVARLLETRRGRCGEFADCFHLLLRALGYRARHVANVGGDHVWNEVWQPRRRRWLHADPCEAALDSPLLYEAGWKRAVNFIIAANAVEVQDVTLRYTEMNYKEVFARRPFSETLAQQALFVAYQQLNRRYQRSAQDKVDYVLEGIQLLALAHTGRHVGANEMKGRESGDRVWRAQRGEADAAGDAPEQCSAEVDLDLRPAGGAEAVRGLLYSCADDAVTLMPSGRAGRLNLEEKWTVNEALFRKEELDWGKVYFALSSTDDGRPASNVSASCALDVVLTSPDASRELKEVLLLANCYVFSDRGRLQTRIEYRGESIFSCDVTSQTKTQKSSHYKNYNPTGTDINGLLRVESKGDDDATSAVVVAGDTMVDLSGRSPMTFKTFLRDRFAREEKVRLRVVFELTAADRSSWQATQLFRANFPRRGAKSTQFAFLFQFEEK